MSAAGVGGNDFNEPGSALPGSDAGKNFGSRSVWLNLGLVLLAGWLVRGVFLSLLANWAFCFDIHSWIKVAAMLEHGENPYQSGLLNWPPCWMQILYGLSRISTKTGLPLIWCVRIFLVGMESLLVALVFLRLAWVRDAKYARRVCLAGFALNPIAILLVCLHGNFDVVMALWCAGAALCLFRFHRTQESEAWLWACALVGLGILTKTVPLFFLPALALGAARLRRSTLALGALFFVLPAAVGVSVIYTLAPQAVQTHVLGYRSEGGIFGLSGLLHLWSLDRWQWLPARAFVWLYLLGVAAWSWRNRQRQPSVTEILLTCLTALLVLPTLGPGFATQYAYWFIPLVALAWPHLERGLQRIILAVWVTGVAIYLVEYAFMDVYGWFLMPCFRPAMSWGSAIWLWTLKQREIMFCLQLPLFAAFVVWLAAMAKSLWLDDPQQSAWARRMEGWVEKIWAFRHHRAAWALPVALFALDAAILKFDPSNQVWADKPKELVWSELSDMKDFFDAPVMSARRALVEGKKYLLGVTVPKDTTKAVQYFQIAAQQGNAEAQRYLATAYNENIGVPMDAKKVVYWAWKSAVQGNPEAQYIIGEAYRQGAGGFSTNLAEGIRWCRKAGEQDCIPAQRTLAVAYHRGEGGVQRDEREAFNWAIKAANLGDATMQVFVGVAYANGQGVPKNLALSTEWLLKAAEQGNGEAMADLGYFYQKGEELSQGLRKDLPTAWAWFELAAEHHFSGADEQRDRIGKELSPLELVKARQLAEELTQKISSL